MSKSMFKLSMKCCLAGCWFNAVGFNWTVEKWALRYECERTQRFLLFCFFTVIGGGGGKDGVES